jgi:hypothetical protein
VVVRRWLLGSSTDADIRVYAEGVDPFHVEVALFPYGRYMVRGLGGIARVQAPDGTHLWWVEGGGWYDLERGETIHFGANDNAPYVVWRG